MTSLKCIKEKKNYPELYIFLKIKYSDMLFFRVLNGGEKEHGTVYIISCHSGRGWGVAEIALEGYTRSWLYQLEIE